MTPPDLQQYRWVVLNHSGGKDSQAMTAMVVREAAAQNYPTDRIVLSHQSLGAMEWTGTLEHIRKSAAHYGLRLEVSHYRNQNGTPDSLLDYVRKRGKWPSSTNRFCTSEMKRGPGGRVLTKLAHEATGDILNCYGFRAEESTLRAKKPYLTVNTRQSRTTRTVMDWCPILHWKVDEVWREIAASGLPAHWAYQAGMGRLSCVFCIFAPRAALLTAGKLNPGLLDQYCAVEAQIGHDFQHKKPIREIRQMIQEGKEIDEPDTGVWKGM